MKKIYSVGINDANYKVTWYNQSGKRQLCPFYRKWHSMLRRCYGKDAYGYSSVCQEWLYFSIFKNWMEGEDWIGKELDKDLLYPGNTVYSPRTCIFVPKELNSLFVDSRAKRGQHPIGVSYDKTRGTYEAYISLKNKKKFLGYHQSSGLAHSAWQKAKLEELDSYLRGLNNEIYKRIVFDRVNKLKEDITYGNITESLHHF